jgi:uncharacterized protein (DUF1810 family)
VPDVPHDLERFVRAQERTYQTALAEIRSGRKRSHWMWYVFPQIAGLGFSETSQRVEGRTAYEIFGSPDELKFRSCATLFGCVTPPGSIFARVLDKYFEGEGDPRTLELVEGG